MAWDDELVLELRTLLLDTAAAPDYADDQLAQFLLLGARQVPRDLPGFGGYAASLADGTLVPDPTAASPPDDDFCTLVVLRAHLALLRAENRLAVKQGVRIRDDSTEIVTTRDPRSLALLTGDAQAQYDAAVYAVRGGNRVGPIGRCVTAAGHAGPPPLRWAGPFVPGWNR